jgi:transcriptional regulator with GAF, ATPase, and Fis domain
MAESNASVLIQGESGTGKELVARAIYQHSSRKDKPFLAVNCAAIPETLLESELFGHEKGAFTGALQKRIGKFQQCDRGTFFLDEVGDMALTTQAKILRVLQEQTFEPVGSEATVKVDVRVIASTHKDLWQSIENKEFREDLYYRLKVVTIYLPPLRQRKDDIPLLVEYFIRKFNAEFKLDVKQVSPELMEHLVQYTWPGNIRELENAIQTAMIMCKKDVLLIDNFPLFASKQSAVPVPDVPSFDHDVQQRPRAGLERSFHPQGRVFFQENDRRVRQILDRDGLGYNPGQSGSNRANARPQPEHFAFTDETARTFRVVDPQDFQAFNLTIR